MTTHALEADVVRFEPFDLLGSQPNADQLTSTEIRTYGIRVVVSCTWARQAALPANLSARRVYRIQLPMVDVEDPDLLPSREDLLAVFDGVDRLAQRVDRSGYRPRPGDKARLGGVLWHCRAGVNRSAFVLASYLCERGHYPSGAEAIRGLRELRPMVLGNRLFCRALLERYP